MPDSSYRKKWSELKKENIRPENLVRLSRQIAYSFLDLYLKDCHYEEDFIDLLCEMMTFSKNPQLNNPGTQALFEIIIERLCDDFETLQTETYNRVMTQVISFCRTIPEGSELNNRLKKFMIHSDDDMLQRINSIRLNGNKLANKGFIKKILILSRVTIGADVAITSIIIQRLAELYPDAEIVLIGNSKLKEVYGANSNIRIEGILYSRKGGLMPRLSSWHRVLEIIERETASVHPDNIALIDPDSRLSQLGVLPLIPENNYFFFDSRSDTSFNKKMSMVELTNRWLDDITDNMGFNFPKVWIPDEYLQVSGKLFNDLRNNGAENIIVANFGVGGNSRKSVGKNLEKKLLITLLQKPNTVILLDKGFGDQETLSINALIAEIDKQGYPTRHSTFGSTKKELINWGVIGIESGIGEIAALIAMSEEFIGYDSACQHISAALGTPCLTIFAGSNNMRFIRRWSAHGPNRCSIVHVDTLTDPRAVEMDDIITRIMQLRI
ncbi:MAG: glycosyltransferase family 9 protein [Deltaproteobacteria bacterium]|nr:glycosyltransferase family 9 protein [Deltaproteobacteria bacterium]